MASAMNNNYSTVCRIMGFVFFMKCLSVFIIAYLYCVKLTIFLAFTLIVCIRYLTLLS